MSELQNRVEKLRLRLDHMGMRAEQALADALFALREGDAEAGLDVDRKDLVIDREEVEIEQECIRLLALYQPAAIDLRTICTFIKVNSDLERIADFASNIGRDVARFRDEDVDPCQYIGYSELADAATDLLRKTLRAMSTTDAGLAQAVIRGDQDVDGYYVSCVEQVLNRESSRLDGLETAMLMLNLAKALERVGDLCTNIAEDIIFLCTGDIVRHAYAFKSDS